MKQDPRLIELMYNIADDMFQKYGRLGAVAQAKDMFKKAKTPRQRANWRIIRILILRKHNLEVRGV